VRAALFPFEFRYRAQSDLGTHAPGCVGTIVAGCPAGYLSVIFHQPAACEGRLCDTRGDFTAVPVVSVRGVESPGARRVMP